MCSFILFYILYTSKFCIVSKSAIAKSLPLKGEKFKKEKIISIEIRLKKKLGYYIYLMSLILLVRNYM